MTAGELTKILCRLPANTPIYLQNESGWIEANFCCLQDIPQTPYSLWLDHRSWIGKGNTHYSGFEYLQKTDDRRKLMNSSRYKFPVGQGKSLRALAAQINKDCFLLISRCAPSQSSMGPFVELAILRRLKGLGIERILTKTKRTTTSRID